LTGEGTHRVLIVDDDAMAQSWIQLALEGSEFAVAGTASSAAETLDLIERRRPELLLVDYRLPDTVGTELLRDLRQRGISTPAVLMTANLERGFNEAANEAGAQGSVLKSGRADDLLHALRSVAAGQEAFDVRHPKRDPGRGALSPREREVLRRVAAGATNREIAAELGVGEETVKTLMARTFAKLGVRKRAEAVAQAHALGLL
jgi:DNA-binding NarL/FixJ family response regulator